MSEPSEISVGLSHEFAITACKAGWEPRDFTLLAQSEDKLRQMLAFARGQAEIKLADHVVNCDITPFIPDGLAIEEHKKGGQLTLSKTKIELFLTKKQKKDWVRGNDLRKELEGQPVLNANVLDYLLAHPELIPAEWKGKAVFFWGTLYRYRVGSLCVRCLCWSGGGWCSGCGWLGGGWVGHDPAACAQASA